MLVKAVMNKPVTAKDTISVREAAKIMSNRGIGSLIIVKDKKIAGIITERDIMKNVAKLEGKVTGVMSKGVKTIGPEEDVNAAAESMSRAIQYWSGQKRSILKISQLKGKNNLMPLR